MAVTPLTFFLAYEERFHIFAIDKLLSKNYLVYHAPDALHLMLAYNEFSARTYAQESQQYLSLSKMPRRYTLSRFLFSPTHCLMLYIVMHSAWPVLDVTSLLIYYVIYWFPPARGRLPCGCRRIISVADYFLQFDYFAAFHRLAN